jgi:hypothetical protein
VHGEALVRHVVPVLGASALQQRRLALAMAFHFGRMGDDLDVAIQIRSELKITRRQRATFLDGFPGLARSAARTAIRAPQPGTGRRVVLLASR